MTLQIKLFDLGLPDLQKSSSKPRDSLMGMLGLVAPKPFLSVGANLNMMYRIERSEIVPA